MKTYNHLFIDCNQSVDYKPSKMATKSTSQSLLCSDEFFMPTQSTSTQNASGSLSPTLTPSPSGYVTFLT